jgi:peptidoglycan DL-endopeptidase CwlO
MYLWAKASDKLRNGTTELESLLATMRPGDLVFWEGTYAVHRDPPISHVMIYLGREKTTKAPVMVGASDGRSYRGTRRNGVSVFDFKLPKPGSAAKFAGHARMF